MGFKVLTHKEEIGYLLDTYSIYRDISSKQPVFRKGGKEIRLFLEGGKDCEFNPENSELMHGQIMTYSESKEQS